jgi:single-strand DNA-binding protein
VNLCIIEGAVRGEVSMRLLADGTEVAELDVAPHEGPGAVTVVVPSPPAAVRRLEAGQDVLVVGSVRRRFYRSGGATRSVTEVLAEQAVRAGPRTRWRHLDEAAQRLVAASD